MYFRKCMWMIGAAAVLASGCASQKSSTDQNADQSFTEMRQAELEQERRDFVSDRREQLEELNNEMARLEARLKHEAPLAGADERAEWSQDLFELQQQHQQAQAELERAQRATPEEWAEMRGSLDYAVDTLQAGVSKLGSDIGGLFTSDEPATAASAVNLCNLQVNGTNADVTQSGDRLVVEMTNPDPEDRDELRQRAEKMSKEMTAEAGATGAGTTDTEAARADERDPATSESAGAAESEAAAGKPAMVADVEVEDIEGGVRVIFEPAQGQQAALRSALESEVARIQNQRC